MLIADAIAKRILDLCGKDEISINKLAILSGLTQSTIQSIISGKSKNPTLLTIVRICDSLNISLKDFFDDEIFQHMDTQL